MFRTPQYFFRAPDCLVLLSPPILPPKIRVIRPVSERAYQIQDAPSRFLEIADKLPVFSSAHREGIEDVGGTSQKRYLSAHTRLPSSRQKRIPRASETEVSKGPNLEPCHARTGALRLAQRGNFQLLDWMPDVVPQPISKGLRQPVTSQFCWALAKTFDNTLTQDSVDSGLSCGETGRDK